MKFANSFGKKKIDFDALALFPSLSSPEPALFPEGDDSGIDSDGEAEGQPRTLLAGVLVLVDGYRRRPSSRLALCIANHFRDFAAHRGADPVLREIARRLENEWRHLSDTADGRIDANENEQPSSGENTIMPAPPSKPSSSTRTAAGKPVSGPGSNRQSGGFVNLVARRLPLANAIQSELPQSMPRPPAPSTSSSPTAKQGTESNTEKRNLGTRRKLWQLDHQYHCPVVGTCLPVGELRRLARRAGVDAGTVSTMSDYALHVMMVGHAQERTPVAEAIQRELDRRYKAAISRFASARDSDDLLALWHDVLARGDVAAGLWAALTHPAAEKEVTRQVYGDIHMLSHQVGAGHRADLKRLALLEDKCTEQVAAARHDRERAMRRIAELEAALAVREEKLAMATHALHEHAAARERQERELSLAEKARASESELRRGYEALERKLNAARGEITGLKRRLEAQDEELEELRTEHEAAESVLAALVSLNGNGCHGSASAGGDCEDCENCPEATSAAARLNGRCLLCIGGREGLVDRYRGLVERCGGRFLHHDGGIEDNPKRLEATLACADAIVCQAGCVSHAAYWRLKEYCKRYNKPCVYLKRASVSSFARGIALLAGEDNTERLN